MEALPVVPALDDVQERQPGGRVDDCIVLQQKEVGPSVLEAYFENHPHAYDAERVVRGQRAIQATPDIFLGWHKSPGNTARHYYWRQLADMKGNADISLLDQAAFKGYLSVCASIFGATACCSFARVVTWRRFAPVGCLNTEQIAVHDSRIRILAIATPFPRAGVAGAGWSIVGEAARTIPWLAQPYLPVSRTMDVLFVQ